MTDQCVFLLFFLTLDTVLKNCAMSSTLLCLCCHATCRAALLENPVTTTSQTGRETGSVLCQIALRDCFWENF